MHPTQLSPTASEIEHLCMLPPYGVAAACSTALLEALKERAAPNGAPKANRFWLSLAKVLRVSERRGLGGQRAGEGRSQRVEADISCARLQGPSKGLRA